MHMKKDTQLLIMLLSVIAALGYPRCASGSHRVVEPFDFDWKFAQGDQKGAEREEFDDTNWRTVQVPHDWAIEGVTTPYVSTEHPDSNKRQAQEASAAYNGAGYRGQGIAWYRKTFPTPANLGEDKLWVEFEGVYATSEVFLNGKRVGQNDYGYLDFELDLTPYLKPEGATNLLAVKNIRRSLRRSRWYSGAGVFRHVWLSGMPEMSKVMNVVSYNYMQEHFDKDHAAHPEKSFILSESRTSAEAVSWFEGLTVPSARQEVVFTVSGAGTLIATDNGLMRADISWQTNRRALATGRLWELFAQCGLPEGWKSRSMPKDYHP